MLWFFFTGYCVYVNLYLYIQNERMYMEYLRIDFYFLCFGESCMNLILFWILGNKFELLLEEKNEIQ